MGHTDCDNVYRFFPNKYESVTLKEIIKWLVMDMLRY